MRELSPQALGFGASHQHHGRSAIFEGAIPTPQFAITWVNPWGPEDDKIQYTDWLAATIKASTITSDKAWEVQGQLRRLLEALFPLRHCMSSSASSTSTVMARREWAWIGGPRLERGCSPMLP